MSSIEQSRGHDFIVVGFSNDGRAMFAFPVLTIAEFERWKTTNKEYTWRLFNAHGFGVYPCFYHEQISIFDEREEA